MNQNWRGTEESGYTFGMRPEQEEAVNKSITYFSSFKKENPDKTPHFLWNAKMRFGKTFASYQLAKNGLEKVLFLTLPLCSAGMKIDDPCGF